MEDHLYQQLKKFNETVENPYRENWGSTLSYLPAYENVKGRKADEVEVFKSINEKAKALELKRKQAAENSKKNKYVDKYGTTRFGIPNGRSVPKNAKEELKFNTIEKKMMEAQHKVVVKQRNQSQRSSHFQTKLLSTVSNINRIQESTNGGDTIGQDIVLPQRLQGRNVKRIIETLDPKIESGHEQIRIETQGPLTCKNGRDNVQSSGRNDASQLMTFGNDQAGNLFENQQYTEKTSGVFDGTRMTRATGTTLTGTNIMDGKSNSNVFASTKMRPQTSNATAILSNMRGEFSPNDHSGFGDAFISNEQSNRNIADQNSQASFMNIPPNLPIGSRPTHKRAISNLIGTKENQITKSKFKLKDSTVGAWQGTSRSRKQENNYMSHGDSKEGNILLNSQVTDENTQSRHSRSPLKEAEVELRLPIPKPSMKTAMDFKSSNKDPQSQQYGKTIESTSGTFVPMLSGAAQDRMIANQMQFEKLQNQYQISRPLRRINTFAKPTGQFEQSAIERTTRPSVDSAGAKSEHELRTMQATRSVLTHARSQLRNKCGLGQMSERQGQMISGSSRVTARLNSARLDQNTQRIQFLQRENLKEQDLNEKYVTQNVKKNVTQVYQAKRDPLNAKNDHVFRLQQSMRLASKFSGATNTLGKQKKIPSMEVRKGAAKSFKEQRMLLQEARAYPQSRVGPYIKSNVSVKQSTLQAVKEAQAKDLKRAPDSTTAGTSSMSDASKTGSIHIKQKGDDILGNACGFIENPRAINPKNKLQLAMVKHVQVQQLAVTDMFSKKADAIDRHFELEAHTKAVQAKRKAESISNLLKKHIFDGISKKQDGKGRSLSSTKSQLLKKPKSVSDPVFFSKHDPKPCPKSSLNEKTFEERQDKLTALSQIARKEEKNSPAQERISKMPLELRTIIDVDPDEGNRLYKLMGLTNGQYLRNLDVEEFMNKHNFSTERQKTLKSNIQFSKEFFEIIDDDGTGGIELEELAQPLIALGLATDTGFVKRALKVLNPKKFGEGQFKAALTMREFSRIFRTDPVSEKLNALIKEELDRQEDLKMVQLRQNQALIEERLAQWEESGQMQLNPQLFQDNIPEDSDEDNSYDNDEEQIISIENDGTADKLLETDREFQSPKDEDQAYKSRTIVEKQQEKLNTQNLRLSKTDIGHGKNLKVQLQPTSLTANTKQIGVEPSIGATKANSNLKYSKKKVYDINDQVKVVAKWWRQLQIADLEAQKAAGDSNCVERAQLPATIIAKQFLAWRIFQDMTSAKKYLVQTIGENQAVAPQNSGEPYYDYTSFGAVFIKGIFKDVVCGIASSVQNYRRKDEENVSQEILKQKALLWKLSDYKRENLFEMMARGLVRTKQEPQRIVERPIFQNLYNLKYRSDPENWKNANFEKYLEKTINKMPATEDPHQIPIDDYNNKINFIVADYSKEIYAFNQMLNNEKKIHIENEIDFLKHADDHDKDQMRALKKQKLKVFTEDDSPEPVQIEYPNDIKRKKFHLNQEKDQKRAEVERIQGQKSLIDGLDRIQRDEVEKGLLYDQIIINHKIAERQMFLYSNPHTGGLQPDEIVEADHHLPSPRTVASVSPLKESVMDGDIVHDTSSPKAALKDQVIVKKQSESSKKMDMAIQNIRADKKDKYELLDRLTATNQFEIQKFSE